MTGVPEWALFVAGVVLVVVLFEFAPRWGGWLLLLLVLGYLVNARLQIV